MLIAAGAGVGLSAAHGAAEGGFASPAVLVLYAAIETVGALLLLALAGGYLRLLRAPG